ncbi:MAG: hypothetical protein DRO09_00930 [Thermoprotei archaeon]|nr:MAG: hypothetical protein DRO09_00930 [Thermoprotei archaeon]
MLGCCGRRGLLVLIVWAWLFAGLLATTVLIACVRGVPLVIEHLIDMLGREPYLASYAEVVAVGGLPLAISLVCRDDFRVYGLARKGLERSLAVSVPPALAVLVVRTMLEGVSPRSFNLQFPYNAWYATLGVLAYGPLEVFFVVWLTVNTDYALNSLKRTLSPGLLITALAFGLSHIAISPQGGLVNAVKVTVIFFILGLIFKYTKNSVGPMVAWTLINGQVQHLLLGCLT